MLWNPSIDFACGKTLVKFLETKVLNNDNNSFGGLFFLSARGKPDRFYILLKLFCFV